MKGLPTRDYPTIVSSNLNTFKIPVVLFKRLIALMPECPQVLHRKSIWVGWYEEEARVYIQAG
jgi:hypothetical protein